MSTSQLFVNLPVKNLEKSKLFFSKLGYSFNDQFTDENAACMVLGGDNFIMLLSEEFFQSFTNKSIANAHTTTEVIVTVSLPTKESVNDLVGKAMQAGGTTSKPPMDQGWMYGWGFQDMDGHLWEAVYMDPTALAKTPAKAG